MNCPSCTPRRGLSPSASPDGARFHHCARCDGRWIRTADYWRWRARATLSEPDTRQAPSSMPAEIERSGLRFCPDDGYLLTRFLVGSPHSFTIDQCRNCGGAWFDTGEWETLLDGGLATQLHRILSDEWQDRLHRVDRETQDPEPWVLEFDDADRRRILEIKEWLDGHPDGPELYAFLRFHETTD